MTTKKLYTLNKESFVRIEVDEGKQSHFFATFYLHDGLYYEEPVKVKRGQEPSDPPKTLEQENKRIVRSMDDLGFDGQRVFYLSLNADQNLAIAEGSYKDKKGNLTEPGIVYGKVTGVLLPPDFVRIFLDSTIDRAVSIVWDRKTVYISAARLTRDAVGTYVFTVDEHLTLSTKSFEDVRILVDRLLNQPYLESLAILTNYKDVASDALLNDAS